MRRQLWSWVGIEAAGSKTARQASGKKWYLRCTGRGVSRQGHRVENARIVWEHIKNALFPKPPDPGSVGYMGPSGVSHTPVGRPATQERLDHTLL